MVEAGAKVVSEDVVVDAIEFGHECCKKINAGIRELVAKCGKPKWPVADASSVAASRPLTATSTTAPAQARPSTRTVPSRVVVERTGGDVSSSRASGTRSRSQEKRTGSDASWR